MTRNNTYEEMLEWYKLYKELREATKHIKPIQKRVFTGLRNPIRVKKSMV